MRLPSGVSFTDCAAPCESRSKKARILPGSMICFTPRSLKCWCAIRARMRCSRAATRAIRSTLANWRTCYAGQDTTRVMGRLKALYRSQAIATEGKKLYTRRRREPWLALLTQAGQRYRAERMFEQLDALQGLRRQARRDLMIECRKHTATS